MQVGFYFDQSRCTGCYTCTVACHDWHDNQDSAVQWRRVLLRESGAYPRVSVSYISLSCSHCRVPACAEACPVGAVAKRRHDGIMTVDRDTCLGADECAKFCLQACPYDVPQFGSDEHAKMQMCTLCVDRLSEGLRPVCVDACPMRALDAGPLETLQAKYGRVREAPGFAYDQGTCPSIIIKPR